MSHHSGIFTKPKTSFQAVHAVSACMSSKQLIVMCDTRLAPIAARQSAKTASTASKSISANSGVHDYTHGCKQEQCWCLMHHSSSRRKASLNTVSCGSHAPHGVCACLPAQFCRGCLQQDLSDEFRCLMQALTSVCIAGVLHCIGGWHHRGVSQVCPGVCAC